MRNAISWRGSSPSGGGPTRRIAFTCSADESGHDRFISAASPLLSLQAVEVTVPMPRDSRVETNDIEPMLRWQTGNPALRVRVAGTPPPLR